MNNKNNIKPINKGLMFLKLTVMTLFMILVALIIILMMTKGKRQKNEVIINECQGTKSILIENKIQKIQVQGRVLNVLTHINTKTNSQELIRVDSNCGNEINRINFKIKK